MVHINHLFAGEDAAQLGDLERLDAVKLDTSAVLAVLLQNSFTLGKIVARHTIDQHLEIVRHSQLCVWKQRCHAKTGIGWHNTELDFQLRCTFWVILHPAEQFLAHLIAHGIRDNDHRALLGVLQIAGIEVPLQGQRHKCVRLLNGGIPLGKQRFQILVGVDVFHQIAQRLESCRFFELIVSGIEATIFVVQPEVLLLILAQNLFETVRATVIPSLNDLIGAVKHLIAASRLFPKVHFAPLLADLRDGQAIQCCAHILGQKPLYNPLYEDLVDGEEGIAIHQVIRRIIGESFLDIQAGGNMSGKLIIAPTVQDVVHQVVHKGDDVSRLVGEERLPRLRKICVYILGGVGDEHGHHQLFQRRFDIGIAEMLLAELPEIIQ